MYKIYQTEGLVIEGRSLGEADRFLTVFTKDFGMIQAQAQGVRKISSKLRYSLRNFSYAEIDLVQGKEKNESLFEDILRGFSLLSNPKITIDEVNNTEFVLVLRILHRLGYWGEIDGMASLTTSPFNYLLLNEVQPLRKKIISEINKSLKATQ